MFAFILLFLILFQLCIVLATWRLLRRLARDE